MPVVGDHDDPATHLIKQERRCGAAITVKPSSINRRNNVGVGGRWRVYDGRCWRIQVIPRRNRCVQAYNRTLTPFDFPVRRHQFSQKQKSFTQSVSPFFLRRQNQRKTDFADSRQKYGATIRGVQSERLFAALQGGFTRPQQCRRSNRTAAARKESMQTRAVRDD